VIKLKAVRYLSDEALKGIAVRLMPLPPVDELAVSGIRRAPRPKPAGPDIASLNLAPEAFVHGLATEALLDFVGVLPPPPAVMRVA
jgi:hypothetical protein